MPKIILSDFQTAANEKYADFEVHLPDGQVLLFIPAIRMPKAKRTELAKALDIQTRAEVNDGTDLYDLYRDAFRISEKAPGNYDALAAVVGDDPAVWQDLFIEFQEITQPGEA
jgi:hypothetical protein